MGDRSALAVVALPFLLGTVAAPGAVEGEEVFRFQDAEIVESSGLVVQDGLVFTTNDSGDAGRVFAVDPASGETVGVTTWAADPEDVEALAPAGAGEVWVGDIGDNPGERSSVAVARVAVGSGERDVDVATYELVYPDGPQDAETLLAHPRTGRLYVVTKHVFGGTVYAAPSRLSPDRVNRLERVGERGAVLPLATDGAFLPDGERMVLRDYGRAVVYALAGLEPLAETDLPRQRQGEGIAVAADGAAYLSSEGRDAPVLRVDLPAAAAEASPSLPALPAPTPTGGASDGATDAPTPAPGSREGEELPEAEPERRPAWPWFLTAWLGLGVMVLILWALRRR